MKGSFTDAFDKAMQSTAYKSKEMEAGSTMRHRASGELMSQHDVSPSQSHFSKVSSFSAMIEPPVTRRRSNDFSFSSIAEKIQISIKPDCSVALRRWTNTVYSKLPAVDKEAIQRNSNGLQAAAEFS